MAEDVRALWMSSAVFSALVLASYRALEAKWFIPVVLAAAVAHILIVSRSSPRLSVALLASQSVIVATTIASVVAHLLYLVGPVSGIWSALAWHLEGNWTTPRTYAKFSLYLIASGTVLVSAALLARSLQRRPLRLEEVLAVAYSASAVNVACHYAIKRPLFHVSGDPEATVFFFLIGLVGLEFALFLHLFALGGCVWKMVQARRRAK